LQLISNQTPESIVLEYKSSDALVVTDKAKKELAKDVSAFANSAGGTIVFGIREKNQVPLSLDEGADPVIISPEWIEQVINSGVQRRIPGLRIVQIQLGSSPRRVAYAVQIPPSPQAPHQAPDKRYYKRFNFQSVPMEDYEIRDTSRRQAAPELSVLLNVVSLKKESFLTFHLQNESQAPCTAARLNLWIDTRLKLNTNGLRGETWLFLESKPVFLRSQFGLIKMDQMNVDWSAASGVPCFAGCPAEVPFSLKLERAKGRAASAIRWKIISPGCDPIRRFQIVESDPLVGFRIGEPHSKEQILTMASAPWLSK